MKLSEFNHPIPYLIIDDFFKAEHFEQISSLTADLFYLSNFGKHGDVYEDKLLKRNEFYIEQNLETPEVVQLQQMVKSYVWSDEMRSHYRTVGYPIRMIEAVTKDGMLVGYYPDNGYYSLHKDTSFLTFQVFLHKNKEFNGGDFLITDSMSDKNAPVKVRIEAKPNRAVIFPSCFFHGVDKMTTINHEVSAMRISLQYFLTFKEL